MILWSHRGFVKTKEEENTIKALENTFNKGYKNIEFDIWFLDGKLLTKHDEPTKEELENNSLVPLKDFIGKYGNQFQYWMDFKNLTTENIDDFLTIYKNIIDNAGIDYKNIYFAPYQTDWKISMIFHNKVMKAMKGINGMAVIDVDAFEKEKIYDYYRILQENNIQNLSIEHKIVDKKFIEIFRNINIFAWTVNRMEERRSLENLGVKNICTDKILYEDLIK